MSSINFADLIRDEPESTQVWMSVRDWLHSARRGDYYDPSEVVPKLISQGVKLEDFLFAMRRLVDLGIVTKVYKVRDPTRRVYLNGEFKRPGDVPEYIDGRFGEAIRVERFNIMPLFRRGQ